MLHAQPKKTPSIGYDAQATLDEISVQETVCDMASNAGRVATLHHDSIDLHAQPVGAQQIHGNHRKAPAEQVIALQASYAATSELAAAAAAAAVCLVQNLNCYGMCQKLLHVVP